MRHRSEWYLVLPCWILKDDTFEEFCSRFHASWLRTGQGSLGIIGFEIPESDCCPAMKYTVPECEHLAY